MRKVFTGLLGIAVGALTLPASGSSPQPRSNGGVISIVTADEAGSTWSVTDLARLSLGLGVAAVVSGVVGVEEDEWGGVAMTCGKR